jgi:hypothetical protein
MKKAHLGEIKTLQRLEAGIIETKHPENTFAAVLKQ